MHITTTQTYNEPITQTIAANTQITHTRQGAEERAVAPVALNSITQIQFSYLVNSSYELQPVFKLRISKL